MTTSRNMMLFVVGEQFKLSSLQLSTTLAAVGQVAPAYATIRVSKLAVAQVEIVARPVQAGS